MTVRFLSLRPIILVSFCYYSITDDRWRYPRSLSLDHRFVYTSHPLRLKRGPAACQLLCLLVNCFFTRTNRQRTRGIQVVIITEMYGKNWFIFYRDLSAVVVMDVAAPYTFLRGRYSKYCSADTNYRNIKFATVPQ